MKLFKNIFLILMLTIISIFSISAQSSGLFAPRGIVIGINGDKIDSVVIESGTNNLKAYKDGVLLNLGDADISALQDTIWSIATIVQENQSNIEDGYTSEDTLTTLATQSYVSEYIDIGDYIKNGDTLKTDNIQEFSSDSGVNIEGIKFQNEGIVLGDSLEGNSNTYIIKERSGDLEIQHPPYNGDLVLRAMNEDDNFSVDDVRNVIKFEDRNDLMGLMGFVDHDLFVISTAVGAPIHLDGDVIVESLDFLYDNGPVVNTIEKILTNDTTHIPTSSAVYGAIESSGGMVYPGEGIVISEGNTWGTSITDNSDDWNDAYSWGDHATEGYITSIPGTYIEENDNVSLLTNDVGYLTSVPGTYIEANDNISLLNNDEGYISSVPASYIEENDDISLLTNDEGYITSVDISDINATGTANSTTYLRGDGAWETISLGVSNHGNLNGLSDDDHDQYALLEGRSGDTLKINDITEFTEHHGIEIESVLLKDGFISLATGENVNTIETTLTNDDSHIPTSGAVYGAIESSGGMVFPDQGIPVSTGSEWANSITDNSNSWNIAYSWGDHSEEGYLTSIPGTYIEENDNISLLNNNEGFLSSVDIDDINATGTPSSSTYLRGDGAWESIPDGVTDHGELTGLSNDDHSQYALLDGRLGDILKIDDIEEYNAGSGVTIEGVRLENSEIFMDNIYITPTHLVKSDYSYIDFKGTGASTFNISSNTNTEPRSNVSVFQNANYTSTASSVRDGTGRSAGIFTTYYPANDSTIFLVSDNLGYKGMSYSADYSFNGKLDDRWIPDWESVKDYVAANGGGSMVYPDEGIPLSTGSEWGTSITDNSDNWNTAYGWGDHSTEGYLTSIPASYIEENDNVSLLTNDADYVTSDEVFENGELYFGLGMNKEADEDLFTATDSCSYGEFRNNLGDTIRIVEVYGYAKGGSTPNIVSDLRFNDGIPEHGTGTLVESSGFTINSTAEFSQTSGFENTDIPPGHWVWMEPRTVTQAPRKIVFIVVYQKK